jgi:hypothetical protein
VVQTTTAGRGDIAFKARVAASPSSPGIIRSMKITSGSVLAARPSASSPPLARPATTTPLRWATKFASASRKSALSSTTSTRIDLFVMAPGCHPLTRRPIGGILRT